MTLAHAPPLVVVHRVRNGKVVVPPAEQSFTVTLCLIKYEERSNFRRIKNRAESRNEVILHTSNGFIRVLRFTEGKTDRGFEHSKLFPDFSVWQEEGEKFIKF